MVHIRKGGWRTPLLLLGALVVCQQVVLPSEAAWLDQASPDVVKQWAERLGKTLSDMGRKVTRVNDIKKMYKQIGATIKKRDGDTLIKEIRQDIEEMVQQKMDAVKCIMEWAEEESYVPHVRWEDLLREEDEDGGMFAYRSAKFSPLGTAEDYPQPTPEPPLNYTTGIAHYRKKVPPVYYQPIELEPDPHFFNIPVNTSFSTVHVPTNVFDRAPEVIEAIQWSRKIDPVFEANFAADPTLTWQYFGSAKGFMRTYPGMKWKSDGVDLYDCRMQPWYISAVTCSKEVVILVDTSGSMTGMRFSIARLVAHSLLDTFTSNDFVSVLAFSDTVKTPIECFENMLVQATKENVQALKEALDNVTIEGYGNFTIAFSAAFELLESYRDGRDREGCDSCNQAIMLITDGVPSNLTEVFETYNRFNETGEMQIPVRVFTYLLGKEVTNVREIQWMACLNRGWYTHMQSLEEVREEALRYLNVIARPMVLQGDQHPVVWSHAYVDFQDDESIKSRKVQQFQLLTSVSIPVFDKHGNLRDNASVSAELLGVAGVDVPIKLFHERTRPYKIGVNGYAFLVTNNGYILMHPELKAVVQGFARDNFNSVDLTEIEMVDDGTVEPREKNNDTLLLRNSMVAHEEGNLLDIKIKVALDDQRRLTVETRDFFYSPVSGTPFSLGVSLPPNYGTFSIEIGDKFRKMEKAGITSANYFHGNNWRVHPDWVYCRYAHDNIKNFTTPEERMMHFFKKKDKEEDKWKWISDPIAPFSPEWGEPDYSCGRGPIPEDHYYCDEELILGLLLEAKAVNNWYGTDNWDLRDKNEREPVEYFNISMRFIATHTGLTRWQHAAETGAIESHFGDFNNRAIDEDWYKATVLLHEESPDSLLLNVPFEAGSDPDLAVTAFTAIYHQDGGHEVPAAVAGFKLPIHKLHQHLYAITENLASPSCVNRTGSTELCGCASEEITCYLLDTNGYVVVSDEYNDTGRFFGDVAPDAMVALKKIGAYRQMVLYDYQATCINQTIVTSGAAEIFLAPVRWVQGLLSYMVGQFLQIAVNNYMWTPVEAQNTFYEDYDEDLSQEEKAEEDERRPVYTYAKVDSKPCDKMRLLALLNMTAKEEPLVYEDPKPEILLNSTDLVDLDYAEAPQNDQPEPKEVEEIDGVGEGEVKYETENTDTENNEEEEEEATEEATEAPFVFQSRSVIAKRVPNTNLLLVVVDNLSPEMDPGPERWSASPEVVDYQNQSFPCYKLQYNDLRRRPLEGCLSSHKLESEIDKCGRATPSGASLGLGLLAISLVISMLRVESLLF
ncbi:voltage-dependent calcium channel subunit alpha-2/delta-3-like isoform X2 [Neocloeon triangulifer]|uniref:voltage-dependent calcium channel subunit alpha-2/delta-3-like isoform X2 n=1 Tax=Neocloeon triangulifer TaxID=2078957 RepID=UPI00286F692A|nr:voltage-dependent calcium channel subunit alpha-2/delta-3-like isoform X2 [Neocloeon triangulifer]